MTTSYFVKLFTNDEVRRFTFSSTSFDALTQKCLQVSNIQLTPQQQVTLKYEDSENDKVTFNTDAELLYALQTTTNNLLKVHLIVSENHNHNHNHNRNRNHNHNQPRNDRNQNQNEIVVDDVDDEMIDEEEHYGHRHGHHHRHHHYKDKQKKIKELDVRFINHQSCPDDCEIPVGQPFEKIWRFRNSGTLPWPNGTMFLRVDAANDLSAPLTTPVSSIAPNEETDVKVVMKAPSTAGRYQSYFKLCSPNGKKFGQRMRCQIMAVDAKSISPEQMDKAWENLEAMGFVKPGERPNNVSTMLMKYNCDITKIVRDLIADKT